MVGERRRSCHVYVLANWKAADGLRHDQQRFALLSMWCPYVSRRMYDDAPLLAAVGSFVVGVLEGV